MACAASRGNSVSVSSTDSIETTCRLKGSSESARPAATPTSCERWQDRRHRGEDLVGSALGTGSLTPGTDMPLPERRTRPTDDFWAGVVGLIDRNRNNVDGLARHGLAALAAELLEARGTVVPEALRPHLERTRVMALTAQFVLDRVRDVCDGSILLVKGPEAAIRYPHGARGYGDLDLLVPGRRRSSATAARRGVRGDAGPRGHLGGDSPPPAVAVARVALRRGAYRAELAGRTARTVDRRVARCGGPLAGGSRGRGRRHPRTRPGAPRTSPRCTRLGASAARASTRPGRRGSVPRRGGWRRDPGDCPTVGHGPPLGDHGARDRGTLAPAATPSLPAMGRARARAPREDGRRRPPRAPLLADLGVPAPNRPRGGSVGRCSARSAPQATRGGARSSTGRSLPSAGRSHRSTSIGACWARRRAEERGPPTRRSSLEHEKHRRT